MSKRVQAECEDRTCQFCTGKHCKILNQSPEGECTFKKQRKSSAERQRCDKNPKDDYSDKDFEEVFQYAQRKLKGDIESEPKFRYYQGCRSTKRFKYEEM